MSEFKVGDVVALKEGVGGYKPTFDCPNFLEGAIGVVVDTNFGGRKLVKVDLGHWNFMDEGWTFYCNEVVYVGEL